MENILLLCGGDGQEHQISLLSKEFIKSELLKLGFNIIVSEIKNKQFLTDGKVGYFDKDHNFNVDGIAYKISCAIPCIHGYPGETGDIQSFLTMHNIPFIGCDSEASRICFNKVTTKLYFDAYNIPNTPFIIIASKDSDYKDVALKAFDDFNQDVYVKAASQGSSVGCYHVTKKEDLLDSIVEAFIFSNEVIIEKTIEHRELEIAAYEINGKLKVSNPGEIIIPSDLFYTYDEKYSKDSKTITTTEPKGLSQETIDKMKAIAIKAFKSLKLRDLSRIDFFLTKDNEIILNEINTFPGMTPISMFPKLLEHEGDVFKDFLKEAILRAIANNK